MSKFLADEKPKQAAFKASAADFSEAARNDGVYRKNLRPFCLPVDLAEENLFPAIRESAPAFFASHSIKWHDGHGGKPSNHLCDSQVCCVNFLSPFADQPDALAVVMRRVFPQLKRMLPVEDGRFVSFEWIGAENYLNEVKAPNRQRSRGALFTSADAIVRFEDRSGRIQVVLIEWKYTESYSRRSVQFADSGRDKTTIYRQFYDIPDCPIDHSLLPGFDSLFYEPFYQFMRQQFLAHEMEKAHELGADVVSLMHISPAHNLDFKRITSPALTGLGDSATAVWKSLVRPTDRFLPVHSEDLFGGFAPSDLPGMDDWLKYIYARYAWVNAGE